MVSDIWSTTERIFLSFWTTFCPFTPLTTQKIKILKKWKNRLEISSFYTSVPKIMIIFYTVPELWHVTDVICFSFWAIFCPFTPQKSKFSKNEKKSWRYHHFTHVHQKLGSDNVRFLKYGVWWTDGKSDI